jgi:hypothetical protein
LYMKLIFIFSFLDMLFIFIVGRIYFVSISTAGVHIFFSGFHKS